MDISTITPDHIVWWQWGIIKLNATIVYTWLIMGFITLGGWYATRRVSPGPTIPRWQNFLEVLVQMIRDQIREIGHHEPTPFIPFIGTLFLFIAVSNLLSILPAYHAPTGSLSTTAALSLCVFFAVPYYGITRQGIRAYCRHYLSPSAFMLPFHIIGELSRTVALAVRLFGNIMSGAKIIIILLAIAPLFFPVLMHALELLIGLIQAYIFAILAMVYIASGLQSQHVQEQPERDLIDEKGE